MAAVVRLPRVLADDFPINDGGFFFVMINELVGAKLALPLTTSYNGGCIPFTYPPLALYTAAAVHLATGASILGLLRFLPLIANLGTAAVFFFLARSVLGTASRAGLASLTFVLLPRSYEYLIMGGGLTRSFGFLFACLAVACGHRLFVGRRTAAGVPTAVALALAVLSHPEMGLWAAATLVLVVAVCGPDRRTIVAAAFVAVGAAAITSPWLVAMLTRHGLAPFLAASNTVTLAGPGLDLQFKAVGNYIHPPDSRDITSSVAWQSAATQVVSINATGLATSGAVCGTNITITATAHSDPHDSSSGIVVGTAAVTVTQPPLC